MQETEKRKKKIPTLTLILAGVSIMAIAASIWFYVLYSNKQSESAKQQQIVDKVARVIALPQETPTVVTVADKDRLTNKQLATKVDNGDVLLVFAQSKKLVIYRPSSDKVTNMLSFENAEEVAPSTQSQTTNPAKK